MLVGCSRSAVVSIYRQWSEEGQITNRRQGVGCPRLIDAQGQRIEGYPIWSEPTEGVLWHKSQKILMVVTGGMCHNPQCNAPCCVWGCGAADRSECPIRFYNNNTLLPAFSTCSLVCGRVRNSFAMEFHSKYGHEAFRFGCAPNKGMRHFPPNGRRADQSQGGPWQEGGAATRRPPNGSRPRTRGPHPEGRKKERIIASRRLEALLSGLR